MEAVFGAKNVENVSDSLKRKIIKELMSSRLDDFPLGRNLVNSAILTTEKAAINWTTKDRLEFPRQLAITLAMYRKSIEKERKYNMELDRGNNNRDYLYGRLLAIYDKAEEFILDRKGENRFTSARKLMPRFSNHPNRTFKEIQERTLCYWESMKKSSRGFYEVLRKEENAIMEQFSSIDDFDSNKPLSGRYLIGFSHQRRSLSKKNEKNHVADDRGACAPSLTDSCECHTKEGE
jgi:CRISPR-associated protein Csd1